MKLVQSGKLVLVLFPLPMILCIFYLMLIVLININVAVICCILVRIIGANCYILCSFWFLKLVL